MVSKIEGEFIQLNQLLKKENIVGSGGEAKMLITDGAVKVNGVTATEIRKKIRPGDTVTVAGETITVE